MDSATVLHWLGTLFNIYPDYQGRIVVSLVVVALIWLMRLLLLKIVYTRIEDIKSLYRWRKTTAYTGFALAFLFVSSIWFKGFSTLSTFLGLLSAGVAIALRDPLVNLAGWAFILWRNPFEVGDRIQIGETAGDVIDQRIFQFTLMEIGNWVQADQSTGRIIHVPNGKVFTEPTANYNKGFQYLWNEIPVLVTFESDWRKAKQILQSLAARDAEQLSTFAQQRIKKAAEKFMIFYNRLTPTVYTSVQDCGVLLTIRYLCDPRQRRSTEQVFWEDILDAFAACSDIDFAYPTQRFYNNMLEGKADAKAGAAAKDAQKTGPHESFTPED
jgi:small-conductance mechanosensitive channel